MVIDGNAILHRAFHALPPLTTKEGELVNAVFGFTSMILRLLSDLRPGYIIVTFDRPTPTFRKALYAGYQAQRPKMDDGLSSQIQIVHTVVETMGIPIYEMDGYEADDVIGTIVEKVRNQNLERESVGKDMNEGNFIESIIVTGDRDILQLVDSRTRVYMPIKGLTEAKMYGEKEVEEKFGIKPHQVVDYKSLVGDASDNYPGVAGIGPKTASSLIQRFGTLENIYTHLGDIENERVRLLLAENAEAAGLAKKLATITKDVPISLEIEKSKVRNYDRPHIHKLFEDLEFSSLIGRLSTDFKETSLKTQNEVKKEKIPRKTQTADQIKLF